MRIQFCIPVIDAHGITVKAFANVQDDGYRNNLWGDGDMAKFMIQPHGRLNDWVADEKGY